MAGPERRSRGVKTEAVFHWCVFLFMDFPYSRGMVPSAEWPPIDLTQTGGRWPPIQNPPIDRFSAAARKKLTPQPPGKA
jgi:hypothetical protein